MAKKVYYVISIVVLLASAYLGEAAPDWVYDLTENINAMTRNIEERVNRLTQNLHSRTENLVQQIDKQIENLPKDAQGRIITNGHVITNGANMISINSVNGMSRIIMSGRTPNGEPYVNITEERNDGKYLYHDETSYNPRTNVTERIRWKLDLTTPGAKPEILTDE